MLKWVSLIGALMALVGCGAAIAADDPFVGAWMDPTRPDLRLTINAQGGDYVVVAYRNGTEDLRVVCTRDADDETHLTAGRLPEGFFSKPGVHYDPGSGYLQFSPFGKSVELRRTSDAAP